MLKKISIEHVRLGMHLQAFCGAWLDHPFWRTEFVLVDPKDITLIRESQIRSQDLRPRQGSGHFHVSGSTHGQGR